MTQEYPSEFLLTVSGIQHRVPRRTLSPRTAPAYWAYNPFRVLLASARIPKPLHPAGLLLGLPTGCGPSPCGQLSRPPTTMATLTPSRRIGGFLRLLPTSYFRSPLHCLEGLPRSQRWTQQDRVGGGYHLDPILLLQAPQWTRGKSGSSVSSFG
jgi:hypothetical protein